MLVDEGLEILTEDDSLRLLAEHVVGRVGMTVGALPAIHPVNYRLLDGWIVFRTAAGSKLSAAATGAVLAFEIDDYDTAEHSGWSVLAVGRAEVVDDHDVAFAALDAGLQPMAGDRRGSIVRIRPEFVSGRRIVSA